MLGIIVYACGHPHVFNVETRGGHNEASFERGVKSSPDGPAFVERASASDCRGCRRSGENRPYAKDDRLHDSDVPLVGAPWMTLNESRAAAGLQPVLAGDKRHPEAVVRNADDIKPKSDGGSAAPSTYDTPAWKLILDALEEMPEAFTLAEMLRWFEEHYPKVKPAFLAEELRNACINKGPKDGRPWMKRNVDRRILFMDEQHGPPTYTRYRPEIHGPAKDGRLVESSRRKLGALIQRQQLQAESDEAFDPTSLADGRERTMASVVRRRGQPKFREALLEAYEGKCAVTGCEFPPHAPRWRSPAVAAPQ